MTKKIITFLILGIIFTGIGYAVSVSAQDNYTLLAPLQDLKTVPGNNPLGTYIPFIFKMLIGLAVVAAVLNIVIGGFLYMSTDAIQGKSQGRDRIKNAIIALVLIISAWLILNTINPKLLDINLNIQPAVTTAPKGVLGGELSAGTGRVLPWYPLTPAEVTKNNDMRKDLLDNYKVNVNAGPCVTEGQTTGCTNLVGMTSITFRGVTDLKRVCPNCNITISGGTEGGHASHGPNLPPVDLRPDDNLNQYILNNQVPGVAPQTVRGVGTLYTSRVGSRNATFLKEADHWHVVFE